MRIYIPTLLRRDLARMDKVTYPCEVAYSPFCVASFPSNSQCFRFLVFVFVSFYFSSVANWIIYSHSGPFFIIYPEYLFFAHPLYLPNTPTPCLASLFYLSVSISLPHSHQRIMSYSPFLTPRHAIYKSTCPPPASQPVLLGF